MKLSIVFLILSAFSFFECTPPSSASNSKASMHKDTLNQSINIFRVPNESFMMIPKGSELPASEKRSFTMGENQLLSFFVFKDNGEELNENNLIGEFYLQQYKETDEASEIEVEVRAESNSKTVINARDVKTDEEKTMIFIDSIIDASTTEDYLLEKMNQLKSAGGVANYVIFKLDNGYFIQLASGKGDDVIRCEALISNGGTDGNFEVTTLSKEQLEKLEELGWSPPDFGEYNYFYWDSFSTTNSFDRIAKNFLQTIESVYDGTKIIHTTINLEKGWSE